MFANKNDVPLKLHSKQKCSLEYLFISEMIKTSHVFPIDTGYHRLPCACLNGEN